MRAPFQHLISFQKMVSSGVWHAAKTVFSDVASDDGVGLPETLYGRRQGEMLVLFHAGVEQVRIIPETAEPVAPATDTGSQR